MAQRGFVGAQHEFHDATFVRDWANRFVPSAPRLALFDQVLGQIRATQSSSAHVVELGLGPGYMARYILEREASISYEGLDFSDVFFTVARQTIGPFMDRVTLTKADLTEHIWPRWLARRPDAIISTWALHDLGSVRAIADVYARCFETLAPGGLLVNGDFIKPEDTDWDFEPGRFEVAQHLALLRDAGFTDPAVLGYFETNIETPTAAQNYVCLAARR